MKKSKVIDLILEFLRGLDEIAPSESAILINEKCTQILGFSAGPNFLLNLVANSGKSDFSTDYLILSEEPRKELHEILQIFSFKNVYWKTGNKNCSLLDKYKIKTGNTEKLISELLLK